MTLNRVLDADHALRTAPCADYSVVELHRIERTLLRARSPQLNRAYRAVDGRRLPYESDADLTSDQRAEAAVLTQRPDLTDMVRDGHCHNVVMMWAHHVPEVAKPALRRELVLPRLPAARHAAFGGDAAADAASVRYNASVSCAICHQTDA